ncbi:NADH-quinone oxidoreductase subunit N [Parapedobacter tibetensis]|uniref:NADH-quinone oxidoreductase subunit N n=1 Tax=Parapedobacter tibetensis TaxID=2972951 RepID=UPI00214DB886|nr:NADH-quinone oxidoreductase subunit N [Parapedobacter tibetensis]
MTEFLLDLSEQLDHILSGLPALVPELVLAAAFVASIFSGLFLDRGWRHATFTFTVAGIALAGICSGLQLASPSTDNLLFGMVLPDVFGQYIRMLIAVVCLLFATFVHFNPDFTSHHKKTADLYSILLAVNIGLNLMAMATNWLMAFVAIELVSIGSYIMVGYLAKEARQTEAAMKYALFGAVCSAVMLYGLSLVYGLTGNLDFTSAQHIQGLSAAPPVVTGIALLLVFTGIGFKLSFVPFHFWSPDVYQGAPTPVTAFLSTAPKIAGIALLTRIFYAWPENSAPTQSLYLMLLVSAIATMLLGNLAALRQNNVKRMMAYSSIGHTGFLMMAVLAYSPNEHAVLLFYLSVYALMNMGTFILADYIESRTGATEVTDYKGLGKILPVAFVCFVILLVSLTGLPPTAGFIGKLLVFSAVFSKWQASADIGLLVLLITGALTTVISLFYYFKVPLNAFLRKEETPIEAQPLYPNLLWLAALITAAVLLLGIFPYWLVDLF